MYRTKCVHRTAKKKTRSKLRLSDGTGEERKQEADRRGGQRYIYAHHSGGSECTRLKSALGSRSEGRDDDDDPWHRDPMRLGGWGCEAPGLGVLAAIIRARCALETGAA